MHQEEIMIDHHFGSEEEAIEAAAKKFGFIPGVKFTTGRHGELIINFDERDTSLEDRLNLPGLMNDLKDEEERVIDVHF